jgi:heat shock protein HtpX
MNNQLKTFVLLATLTALLLWFGQLLGGIEGLAVAGIVVMLMNFVTYFWSDKIVLMIYKAKEAKPDSKLYRMVQDLARQAKMPMPKVYTVPSKNPNAFATGRDPEHAAVACTDGILELLDEPELKGVIAHELSHIRNRDTLIQTVAATIAGVISYAATMIRWGFMGGRDRDNGSLVQLIVLAIVAPIVATILQLAISRQREYLADSTAAKITNNPNGLADALLKIEAGVKAHPMALGDPSTSSLFIMNPFRGSGLLQLFSTHPPIAERVKRLKGMKLTHD